MKKLSLKKVQLTKINSMANIRGGNDNGGGDACLNPEDASKPDHGIKPLHNKITKLYER